MATSPIQRNDLISRYILPGIGVLLLIYTFTRASMLSITHDEALIYLKTLDTRLWEIFNYRVLPQDHMINTLLIKLSMMLFPDSPFFVRLPNLLGHVIYIIASYFIAIRFTDKKMSIIAFVLLNLNPYLLDFFSIARGYGLSTSFTLVSIYFTILFARTDKIRHLLLGYMFAVAAVLTVFSLLIYFVALLGWTGIYFVNKSIRLKGKLFQDRKIVYLLLIVIVSVAILFIKLHEALALTADAHFIHFEQHGNFYTNTIRSVLYNSTYSHYPYTGVNTLSLVYGIFFLAALVRIVAGFFTKKSGMIKSPLFIIFILFIGSTAGIMYLHHFRGIVYPTNRTATFIYPMLILPIVFLFYKNLKPVGVKYSFLVLSALLAISMIYFTLSYGNFKYYIDWQYDASTGKAVSLLQEEHQQNPDDHVDLGINWLFEPSVNFYRVTRKLDWLGRVDRQGIQHRQFDYYYVFEQDTVGGTFRNMRLIKSFPLSKSLLLENGK